MSEMIARERIAELLEDVSRPSERVLHNEENVDIILAIVREALLSDEAVEASISSAGNEFIGVRADAEDMLAAALDAAFGHGKTLDTDRV